jgi:hypothetical protein
MAETIITKTGNGSTTQYVINFALWYIKREDIYVYLEGDTYTNQLGYTWINDYVIQMNTPVANGVVINIRRVVDRLELTNSYANGAILRGTELDNSFLQSLMIAEEISDGFLTATKSIPTPEELAVIAVAARDLAVLAKDAAVVAKDAAETAETNAANSVVNVTPTNSSFDQATGKLLRAQDAYATDSINFHEGNTNFNVFGNTGSNDRIARGICCNSYSAFIELPLNSLLVPNSINISGTFKLVDESGTTVLIDNLVAGAFGFSNARPSNKLLTILLSLSSSILTAKDPVYLQTSSSDAKITVGF